MPAPMQPIPRIYIPPRPEGWRHDMPLEYDEQGFLLPARIPLWKRAVVWIARGLGLRLYQK
jgi:hypothetical protein